MFSCNIDLTSIYHDDDFNLSCYLIISAVSNSNKSVFVRICESAIIRNVLEILPNIKFRGSREEAAIPHGTAAQTLGTAAII